MPLDDLQSCFLTTLYPCHIPNPKKLELEFTTQCRLISIREQAIKTTEEDIGRITKEQTKCSDLAFQLRKECRKSFELLLKIFAKLFSSDIQHEIKNIMEMNMLSRSRQFNEQKILKPHEIQHGQSNVHATFALLFHKSSFIEKCRILLQEIDRVHEVKSDSVASAMLHSMPQLFPKKVLCDNLYTEMKKLILEQIKGEESSHPLLDINAIGNSEDKDDISIDTFDSENVDCFNNECKQSDHEASFHCHNENKQIPSKLLCRACGTYPCSWISPTDVVMFREKRENLSTRVLSMRKERLQALVSGNSDEKSLNIIEEGIKELNIELVDTDCQLSISAVDKELHDSFNSTSKYLLVRSLHGYDTLMHRTEAIDALTAEHDHLVAKLASKEVLNDILDRSVIFSLINTQFG